MMQPCIGKSLRCRGQLATAWRDPEDPKNRVFYMCEACAGALVAMGSGLRPVKASTAGPQPQEPPPADALGSGLGRLRGRLPGGLGWR